MGVQRNGDLLLVMADSRCKVPTIPDLPRLLPVSSPPETPEKLKGPSPHSIGDLAHVINERWVSATYFTLAYSPPSNQTPPVAP